MYKLWNANFARLRMSATFRVGILVAAVLGLVCPTLGAWFSNKIVALTNGALGHYVEEGMSLDYFLFTWVLFLAVYFALHCSCFVGTEYSNGTLRNKIAAGYSRAEIYLTNFIANAVSGCVLYTIYLIADWCAGRLYVGKIQIFTQTEVLLYILCMYTLMIALAGIFTMAAMLIPNEAFSAIVCIGIMVVLLLIPVFQTGALHWEEYFEDEYMINGMTYTAGSLNPYYVGGIRRELSIFFMNFQPGGPLFDFYFFQGMLGEETFYIIPEIIYLGAVFFAVVPTMVGMVLFRRKELK